MSVGPSATERSLRPHLWNTGRCDAESVRAQARFGGVAGLLLQSCTAAQLLGTQRQACWAEPQL